MNYRPDIDGLRAFAVLSVIFFHAGWPFMDGGFIGVDIFFVISGYLITTLIIKDLQQGSFSFADFYVRRIRRILPVLYFVVLVSLFAGWFVLSPQAMEDLCRSAIATVLFFSNIFFMNELDYFGGDADFKPLLHTWSLSIEEQYYIVFPLLIVILIRFFRRYAVTFLILLALMSLGLAEWASRTVEVDGFYLLPMRFWEFIAGALMAFSPPARVKRVTSELLTFAGFLLICAAIVFFDPHTAHPGILTLMPVTGVALLLRYGVNPSIVTRVLSFRPFVGIGLISYSLYLWHHPVFVLFRIEGQTSVIPAEALALCVLLSVLTYKFIEQPFRNRRKNRDLKILPVVACAGLCILAVSIHGKTTDGYAGRFSDDLAAVYAYEKYDFSSLYREGECFLSAEKNFNAFSKSCATIRPDMATDVLWGDSYAASLQSAFFENNESRGDALFAASACPPLLGVDIPDRTYCREINQAILDFLEVSGQGTVYLMANWLSYNRLPAFESALQETIKAIKNRTGFNVVIVGSLPQWSPSLPKAIARNWQKKEGVPEYVATTLGESLRQSDRVLQSVADAENVDFISLIRNSCVDDLCKASVHEGGEDRLLAWDAGHLTAAGAEFYSKALLFRPAYSVP